MDSKNEKRLYFKWQKSFTEYILMITVLLGMFSTIDRFSGGTLIFAYVVLALVFVLIGVKLIGTHVDEKEYLECIRDKRYKKTKWDKIRGWVILALYIILAGVIIVIGMEIWRQLFTALFR